MNNKAWIDEAWEKLDKKLSKAALTARDFIPYTTKNGKFFPADIDWWTNGFWPGMMWLMYDATKNEVYRETAEKAELMMDEALSNYDCLHHDVGFMWHLSSGANHRLTGNKKSYMRNMFAANVLAGRFNLKSGYIRAWNGERCRGYAIIDCMMNIPLLYWASEHSDDDRFKFIAMAHADTTLKYHIREDGSVNHQIEYNPDTGEIVENHFGQGYEVGSSWSRGQGWALYGFTRSYMYTKEERYLTAAKRVANYFIAAVCGDWLARCDFRAPKDPVIYDASAGLIAACGLLELAKCVGEYEHDMYYNAAVNIVKATTENFADWSEETDAVITHGTVAYHCNDDMRHINMIYSDFYYAEALNKLKGFNTQIW